MELVELRKKKRKKKLIYLYSDSYRSVENTIKKIYCSLTPFSSFSAVVVLCVLPSRESTYRYELIACRNHIFWSTSFLAMLRGKISHMYKYERERERERNTHTVGEQSEWVSEWVREEKEMKNNCKHNEWNTNKLNKHEFNIDIRWCAWWFPPLCVLLYMAEKKEHRVRDR
jgi:hypothetical protein